MRTMHDNKQIIYLGYCVNRLEAEHLSGASVAGNNMQLELLTRLYSDNTTAIITVYPVASYPKERILYFGKTILKIENNIPATRVRFLNVPILKQIHQAISVYRCAKDLLSTRSDAIVLCWNAYPQIGCAARWLKRKFPSCQMVCYLADLPIDDHPSRRMIGRWLYNIFNTITKRNLQCFDKAIVLNENAAKQFLPPIPYLIIEGGVSSDETPLLPVSAVDKEKNVLFSGKLIEYNGICTLIDAMELLWEKDHNVRLDIYGDGPLKEYVISKAKHCRNICYKGFVSNSEIRRLQRQAYLLINPRPVNDLISQVTFPSKMLEYLESGTPVLSTRLAGFRNEYNDKLFFAESDSADGLSAALLEVFRLPVRELDNMASRAQIFVTREKSWDIQLANIKKFLMAGEEMSCE